MEIKVEALEGNRAKVTVTIDESLVTDRIKKQYKAFANQYNFPGFRKGKAPRPVVDSMLGKDAVAATVTDAIVNEHFPKAIEESGIYPVGEPDFGEETMELAKDKEPYTFTFEIGVKPVPELSSYEPIAIEMPHEGATDEQIDEEIEALLEHYYEIVEAPENTKVKEDKYVDMKISATDDNGEDIPSITSEETQYGIGSGLYPAAFDEHLIGLKKGDTVQFTMDIPSEPTAMTSTLMGKTSTINFDIEILAVKKKKLPELTDEWVSTKIGVDSVEELRQELAEEIESAQDSSFPRMKENRVLEALAKRFEGELPAGMVEESEASLLQDFFQQMQRQGVTLDAYLQQAGISSQQFRDDVKKQAEDMTRQDLALDAIAAHEGFEVTEEDILTEFRNAGASDPEKLMEQWRENGQMYLLRQGILRQKAAKQLVDTAIVTEEAPAEEKVGKHAAAPAEAEAEPEAEPVVVLEDVPEAEPEAAPEDAPEAEAEAAPEDAPEAE